MTSFRVRFLWTVAAAVALALVVVTIGWALWPGPFPRTLPLAVAWVAFTIAAWSLRSVPVRTATALILVGGVVLPLLGTAAPPRTSDDLYRYQWDGRVQASGIDPYRYAPAAPELAPLRAPPLWTDTAGWCVLPGAVDAATGDALTPGCTRINRPAVHTIYPPVAQAYFLAVWTVTGPGSVRPLQLAAALAAIAVTVLLLLVLPRRGIDVRRAALWAWCPTVALEAGNNAHVDVVAALLTAGALLVAAAGATAGATAGGAVGGAAGAAVGGARRRAVIAGVLLGLAVATKLSPALAGPALLRRRPLVLAASALGAVAVVYLPHVLSVGAGVFGYLPGYLHEEGYADGSRFDLLTLVVPGAVAAAVAALLLAIVSLWVARTADPDQPWLGAVLLTGVALLVTTPLYPWYALLLVLLVALSGQVRWLAVAAAGYVALHAHDLSLSYTTAHRLGYGAALLAVLVAFAHRHLPARRRPLLARPSPDAAAAGVSRGPTS